MLGISAYYHDSAAALIHNGQIVAAAQEERFTRRRHDSAFPAHAIRYCLEEAGIDLAQVNFVCYYEKPFIKFERLLETYLAFAPRGFASFLKAMPIWLKEKLFLKTVLRRECRQISADERAPLPQLLFAEHHRSHAASAFYPSPYDSAAVICMDGVGEWTTTSIWHGQGASLDLVAETRFPHSLGLFYSAFTYYCGFKVNSGEYKLMGLAPYGKPVYTDLIKRELIDVAADGSFRLNMAYFDFCVGNRMINERFCDLFGAPAREPESELTQLVKDVAASVQQVIEEIVLLICRYALEETGSSNLCLAGGVALNCVANGRLAQQFGINCVWIQPAAGDAGGALGAALLGWHEQLAAPRGQRTEPGLEVDSMAGARLGPSFSHVEVRRALETLGACFEVHDEAALNDKTARALANGQIVGWFQGRMEFGPRALGARSILADARRTDMQKHLNLSIKYRESFRPFAPVVRSERAADYFELAGESPFMTFTAPAARPPAADPSARNGTTPVLPATTHVDGSARVQTVDPARSPELYALLRTFEQLTGCPVLVNTSFNVRGEPIVCTPVDAYRCFMRTEMDVLVIGRFFLEKKDQPPGIVLPASGPETRSKEQPTPKDLRSFGLALAAVALLIVWLTSNSRSALLWTALPAAVLAGIALARPAWLEIPMRAFERLSFQIRRIMNPLILGIVFFGVFFPFGSLLKIFRHDPLRLRAHGAAVSYYAFPGEEFSGRSHEPYSDMTRPY